MSEDLQQQEATGDPAVTTDATPVVVADTAPVEREPAEQRQPAGDDIETRARAQGWVSKDEFRGDPEKWRPADEFVRRGEELLPIAIERARAAERRIQELEAQFQQKLSRVERVSEVALRRQREDLESRYAAALRDAAANGDVERYDQISQARHEVFRQFDDSVREQTEQRQPAPQDVAAAQKVQAWISQNPWFTIDGELNAVAQAHHMKLLREKPGLSLDDNLSETRKYVQQRYPDRFGVVERRAPSASVEAGGGRMPAASTRKTKGANDLPADVRAVAERFVRDGLFKDVNEYAREFFADN